MKRQYLMLVLMIMALAACNASGSEPAVSDTQPTEMPAVATPETADSDDIVIGEAQVDTIKILLMESFPVQVSVQASGYLSDGCTTLGDIETRQEDDTFLVSIATRRLAEAMCTQEVVAFQDTIALNVQTLSAGTYTVDVNGVTNTFTLDVDNVSTGALDSTLPEADMAELMVCELHYKRVIEKWGWGGRAGQGDVLEWFPVMRTYCQEDGQNRVDRPKPQQRFTGLDGSSPEW